MSPISPLPGHRRRLRRIEGFRHARCLTFSCFQRRPFLRSERSCAWMRDAVLLARAKHPIHIWAYVFMPEHVHLLLFPLEPTCRIGPVLTTIKQSVSKRSIAWVRQHAPSFIDRMTDLSPAGRRTLRFWQRGAGYDRNLTTPAIIHSTIDYIHANPVARGLCARPTDWPWSSAREFEHPGSGPIPIDFASIPPRKN